MSPFNKLSPYKEKKIDQISSKVIVFATLALLFLISVVVTSESAAQLRGSLEVIVAEVPQEANATISSSTGLRVETAALTDYTLDSNDAMEQTNNGKEEVDRNASHETAVEDEVDAVSDETVVGEEHESSSRKKAAYQSTDDDDVPSQVIQLSETAVDVASDVASRLLARSLQVKEYVIKKLSDAIVPAQSPKYTHYLVQKETIDSTDHSCDQLDAFAGISVEDSNHSPWVPPEGFPTESVNKWNQEYTISMQKIKGADVGGTELRELAAAEVENLRRLRHNLFCGDY